MSDHKSCIKHVATDLELSSCGHVQHGYMFNHTGNKEDKKHALHKSLHFRVAARFRIGVSDYLVIMDSFQEMTLL